MLRQGGDFTPLGHRWVDRFLKRHKRIKTKKSVLLERSRTRGSTKATYEDFYNRLDFQLRSKRILPRNITNMDEHGMQEVETTAGTVIGDSLTNRSLITSPDRAPWVSVIEAVTVEGRRLTPAIVFTGASLQGQWYPRWVKDQEDIYNWRYDYSITGWSNSRIAIRWLKEIYLPETKPKHPTEWRLLILNEASSYNTKEFIWIYYNNRVQLLFLPAYISHKTQPLDRSVFSPLKNYFRQNTKALAHCCSSAPANKQRFLLCYKNTLRRGYSVPNIRNSFRKTGI